MNFLCFPFACYLVPYKMSNSLQSSSELIYWCPWNRIIGTKRCKHPHFKMKQSQFLNLFAQRIISFTVLIENESDQTYLLFPSLVFGHSHWKCQPCQKLLGLHRGARGAGNKSPTGVPEGPGRRDGPWVFSDRVLETGLLHRTPTDIMVGPISSFWFMNQLGKLRMEPQILIDDVAS